MEGQPPTNSIGPNQGAEVSLPPAVQPGVKLVKKLIRRKKLKEAMLQQPNNQKKPVQSATGSPQPSPQEVMQKKQEVAKAAAQPAKPAASTSTPSTQASANPQQKQLQQKAAQVAKVALQKKIQLQKQSMANQIAQQKLAAKNPGLNN